MKHKGTLIIECGWFGFGLLPRGACLGPIRFWVTRSSILQLVLYRPKQVVVPMTQPRDERGRFRK